MSIVYFAHSYRERDAKVVDFFARLIRSEGLTVSLDPPSNSVNASKLQRHMNASDGMVAVLSKRPEGTSPHILFEISLAVKSGKPVLVFVEDTISSRVISPRLLQQRFSLRWYLREVRDHRHALRSFKTYVHDYSPPQFRPAASRRACIVNGLQQLAGSERARILQWIENDAEYEVHELNDGLNPYLTWDTLHNANLAITMLETTRTFTNGLISGIGLPAIEITPAPDFQITSWPPPEYQPRFMDSGSDSVELLKREMAMFEEDFLDLPDQAAVDRYASLLVDLHGSYEGVSRDQVQEVVMGDKYVSSGQTGAVGPNAHVHDVSFQQVWTSVAGSEGHDSQRLAEELETLRQHLRGVAQTREEDQAVAEIGAAASAAEDGDGPAAMSHLSKVGKWAWSAATAIGTGLAAAAIKAAIGF
ncbi:hypothetical protein [Actinomycetospora atypica]|uniref:TIR domain-containing protein n=1 Tax=Actinomycetospora atypica TaxID=1290095 RepID=A0ABV9YHA2_9PSEU